MTSPLHKMSKAECLAELGSRGYPGVGASLGVVELRAMVKQSRIEEGLLHTDDPMVTFRKMNKKDLAAACQERQICCKPSSTTGELQQLLRKWYIQSGTPAMVLDYGRHQGLTFAEAYEAQEPYVSHTLQIFTTSEDCPIQLQRFATWCMGTTKQGDVCVETDRAGEQAKCLEAAIEVLEETVRALRIGNNQSAEGSSTTSEWQVL